MSFNKLVVPNCAVVLILLSGNGVCRGQQKEQKFVTPTVSASTESNAPNVLVEPNEDYRIGPGDVLEIQIDRAPELSNTFRITAAGTFLMPYLGRINAQQKTVEELSNLIADGLRGRYLKDPKVIVIVKQINSHSFFIQGAVRRPGVYQIEGRPSLLKLITITGGLADDHGSTAFVIRETKLANRSEPSSPITNSNSVDTTRASNEAADEDAVKYEMFKTNITGLLRGRFNQNIPLEPGDIVNIPATDVFFVSGEVREPGSYPLKDGTTLRQAISFAQGTTFKAAADRAIIFREDPTSGRREEIKINVDAVMRGAKEDLLIMPNDIIIIPNSRLKSVGSVLLNAFGVNSARILMH
jgi:polysaccharide export outer membrane protein